MDPGLMNESKKLMTKIKEGRTDLGNKDGKTKDRVEGWRKNVGDLTTQLKKQMKNLDELGGDGENNGGGSGDVSRDYFKLITYKLQKDIEDHVKICSQVTTLNLKKVVTSQDQHTQGWDIARQALKNEAIKVLALSQDPQQDKMQLIAKMLNMKDALQKQIFYGCLYRKLILWDDLNIACDEWCHQKVVEAINQINTFQEELKYKPTKLQFQEVNLDTPGFFMFSESHNESDCTTSLDAMIQNTVDMELLIKKNFMIQSEKLKYFAENNSVQMSLREEVEQANKELEELRMKNKELIQQLHGSNKDDGNNKMDQAAQIDKLKKNNIQLEFSIKELNENIEKMKSYQLEQRHKLKEVEDKKLRYETYYIPKLKDTRAFQKTLHDELEKIKQDAELLPAMFRAEAVFRKTCKKEKDDAIGQMSVAMKQHNKLVNERDDLKNELERKQRLAIQAIAARGNMKQFLDEAKQQNEDHMREIDNLKQQLVEAALEVKKFKQKHDDMFADVSKLNARIEELEQHKHHLLSNGKQGDKGDLTYIIKTQKLDQMKPREIKDGVQVENYEPEKNRSARDKEYEEQMAQQENQVQNE